MKNRICLSLLLLPMLFQRCGPDKTATDQSQTAPKEVHVKEFNWTIPVPENFTYVIAGGWDKKRQKDRETIEKINKEETKNQITKIFVLSGGKVLTDCLEASYQPYDIAQKGDFIASCNKFDDSFYEIFVPQFNQIPGTVIDTLSVEEVIDGLTFHVFKLHIIYPHSIEYHAEMYNALVDKRKLTVNIMYVDQKKGDLMLNAWKHSTFGK